MCSALPGCAAQRNFCDGTSCQNGGTCVNRWNTYLCKCPLRFGGKNCEQGEGLELPYLNHGSPGAGRRGDGAAASSAVLIFIGSSSCRWPWPMCTGTVCGHPSYRVPDLGCYIPTLAVPENTAAMI